MLTLKQKIYGAIFGLAIGDALGAPVETTSSDYINQNFGVLNNYLDVRYWKGKMSSDWIKGKWTDDTAFTLEIIKSINMHKDIYPEDIGQRFLELCESGDFDDMLGGTTKRALEAFKNNVDWKKIGTIAMKSKYQGAGGLMRTIPIGIFDARAIVFAGGIKAPYAVYVDEGHTLRSGEWWEGYHFMQEGIEQGKKMASNIILRNLLKLKGISI